MKNLILAIILFGYPFDLVFSQIGGNGVYRFLDLTNSAKVAALGGTQIAFNDNDLDLAFYNPSLLSDSMKNQLSINYVSYIAGIGAGYASFAPDFGGKNTFAAGIHYVNYGKFDGASESGQMTGTFGAAEYSFNLFYAREIKPRLNAGINLKPIISSLESYHSSGLAADIGITYIAKDGLSVFSFVIKNIGGQITTYYDNGDNEQLLPDMQFGFSKRLTHAPIRFFVTGTHLNKWDLSYLNRMGVESQSDLKSENFTSLFMRHLILGAEILPAKHVTVRLGYNYQRQKELAIDSRPGLVGFSAGVGIKIARFRFNYAIASYHFAASAHYFSFAADLAQFVH